MSDLPPICVWKTKLNIKMTETIYLICIVNENLFIIIIIYYNKTSMYHLKQEPRPVGDSPVSIAWLLCLPSTWEGALNTRTFWGGKSKKIHLRHRTQKQKKWIHSKLHFQYNRNGPRLNLSDYVLPEVCMCDGLGGQLLQYPCNR